MYKHIKFLLVSAILFCGNVYGASWDLTGSTNASRGGFNTVTFTDGRIMILGGMASGASHTYEIFEPSTGRWRIAYFDTLVDLLDHSTGILLPNGAALIENFHRQLFTYDPMTSTWFQTRWWPVTGAGSMYQCVTLLNSGRTLLIGHPFGRYTYIYEWPNDTLYRVGDLSGSSSLDEHSWAAEVLLPNGKAMIIGGSRLDLTPRADCEIYDEASGTWLPGDSMNQPRTKLVAVLLRPPYQKVLVASSGQSELYDYVTDQWSYTGALNEQRLIGSMCLLPNGKALIIGGSDLSSCELYDPASGLWTLDAPMVLTRWHFASAILPTGKIIAIGDEGSSADRRCEIYDPIVGSWAPQTSLQTARIAAAITLLPIIHTPNCSTNILITGGEDGSGTALNSCELFNYKENTTALTGNLNTARTHHTLNLMPSPNGEVLTAGGRNGSGALNSAEMYDLSAGTWTAVASMANARFDHTATLLKNGTVLVTGGENSGGYTNTCEIWNGSGWVPTNPMTTPRARHSAMLLLDGKVMVIGGETTGGTVTNTCEIYDPAAGTWSSTPNMLAGRSLHACVLLQSGKVFITGGRNSGGSALTSCEIYNPDSSSWRSAGSLTGARYAHNATLTYAGLVVVSGGEPGDLSSCEIYDPATNLWTGTGTFGPGRGYHASVLVPYLHPYVYAIGGSSSGSPLTSIDRFDFGLGYQDDWQSRIFNYRSVTPISGNMNITGSLFREFSEGDGGNYCHITNTDHPIISLVRIGGGNWQGNGGGDILHMPLSSYWDTSTTNVHPQVSDFQGYFRLWSIVNGIPCKWFTECGFGTEEEGNSTTKAQLFIYPNPATVKTGISFRLSGVNNGQKIALKIFDLSGRLVKEMGINNSKTTWNGKDTNGKEVKSGIYFYSANYKGLEYKGKIVIMK